MSPESTSGTALSTSSDYCDLSGYIDNEYVEDLSIVWVDVEFHFAEDDNGTNNVFHCDENGDPDYYAPDIVRSIINESNNNFRDPCLNALTQSDLVTDARIRFRKFEDDGNPCTGIYFYNTTNINPINFPNGSSVLNVEFRDRFNDCVLRGVASSSNTNIELYDLLEQTKLGCVPGLWNYANLLNHEFGHTLSLGHAFLCNNPCTGIDMDETLECGNPNLPCGNRLTCNQWESGSNNFMGYNGANCAITPCQWGIMMEDLLNDQQQNFANFCDDDSQGPRVIASGTNEIWNDHVYLLNRDVIVETGSTLTINCEVRMGEGKRITVQRGAKLVVDDGKISNLCEDTFWEGIIVYGNANQPQPNENDILQPDDAGVVHVKNQSRIEYAERAIRASGRGIYNYQERIQHWGGVIIAEDSYFTNNKVAAGFMKYEFPNKSKFINCTFEQLPDLDYNNSYGVSIWACHDILFEGNTFKDLGNAGIEGSSFTAKILTGNNFINLFPAIWIRASSSQPAVNPIEIGGGQTGNNFENCPVGIYVTSTNLLNNLIVKNNSFTGGYVGMYLDGSIKYLIDGNSFGGESIDEGMDLGIVTINAGRQFNYASCNSFENVCVPIEARGDNVYFSFLGNDFINASRDIRITGTGTNPGTVRFDQGSVDDTPNNCFGSGINIETVGTTELFRYFIPEDQNAPACLFTTVGGNNYYTEEGFSDFDVCGERESVITPPYTIESLAAIRNDMSGAEQDMSSPSQYEEARARLDRFSEAEEHITRELLNLRISQGDYSGAEALFDGTDPTEAKKMKYVVRMAAKQHESAKSMLLTIPQNTQENIDFVTTRMILVYSELSNTAYELNDSEMMALTAIKNGSTSSRGAADALLWRFGREKYDDSLSEVCESCGCKGKGIAGKREFNGQESDKQEYRIYPNPVNSLLTVEYPVETDLEELVYLRLYSIHGQELLNLQLTGNGKQEIDLTAVSEGIYFLTIQQDDNLLYQDKLIVIK